MHLDMWPTNQSVHGLNNQMFIQTQCSRFCLFPLSTMLLKRKKGTSFDRWMYIGRVLLISEINSSSKTVKNLTISFNYKIFIFPSILATSYNEWHINAPEFGQSFLEWQNFRYFGLAIKTINDFPTWWTNTWILILAWINLAWLICLDFWACILHIPKHTEQRQSNFGRSLINRSHARTHFFQACVNSIYLINWSV